MVDLDGFGDGEGKRIYGKACWEGDAMIGIPEDCHAVLKSVA